jgi:hypothetical protein
VLLAANTSSIRLQTLRLPYWPVQKCEAMNSCIPKLVTLRELDFQQISTYAGFLCCYQYLEACRSFVEAVRRSAGLLAVSVRDSLFRLGRFDSEAETRILNASLSRNGTLPQLLSRPRLDHLVQEGENGTDLYLYPSLLSVSQQSPYGALNFILTGLLALSDDVGF